jgi:hypothetical protein
MLRQTALSTSDDFFSGASGKHRGDLPDSGFFLILEKAGSKKDRK